MRSWVEQAPLDAVESTPNTFAVRSLALEMAEAREDFVDRREHNYQQVIFPDVPERREIWNLAIRWTAVPQFV